MNPYIPTTNPQSKFYTEITDSTQRFSLDFTPNVRAQDAIHRISNETGKNMLIVLSANAGSGDINNEVRVEESYQAHQWFFWYHKSLAGNKGNDIQILKGTLGQDITQATLKHVVNGGSGSLKDILMRTDKQYRDRWKPTSGDWQNGPWQNRPPDIYANANAIAREGEQRYFPMILAANEVLWIKFIHNNSKGFTGSFRIDTLGYIKP